MSTLNAILTAVVQTKSYGPVRVVDALALFEGANEVDRIALAVVYGWSQRHAKAEYLARKGAPVVTARVVNARNAKAESVASHVVASPANETKRDRNRRLWAAFIAGGGDAKSPGGAAWLAYKASGSRPWRMRATWRSSATSPRPWTWARKSSGSALRMRPFARRSPP
jgi:hypothetical protein